METMETRKLTPEEQADEDAFNLFMDDVATAADVSTLDGSLVMDRGLANWVLNKMAGWSEEKKRRKEAYEREAKKLDSLIAWFLRRFEEPLKQFAKDELARTGNTRKSLTLACGVGLSFKNQPAALKVKDTAEFQAWVQQNLPEAFELIPQVDKAEVNKFWKARLFPEGEVIPGCEIREGYEGFYLGYEAK